MKTGTEKPPRKIVCAQFWKSAPDGTPRPDCCRGCPIMRECHTPTPCTREAMDRHAAAMDAAAVRHLSA